MCAVFAFGVRKLLGRVLGDMKSKRDLNHNPNYNSNHQLTISES